MQRCLELSCLPKPASGTKSINFKRTTPGNVSALIYLSRPPNPNRVLDPTHPALHFKPVQYAKAFPWRSYPGFSLRALPKSLLEKPSYPIPNPPFALAPPRSVTLDKGKEREEDVSDEGESEDREDDVGEETTARWKEKQGRISMSLINAASLGVGGRVVRIKVTNKLKNAIALVATRGADVERGPDGEKRIVFRDTQAGPSWVLRDWTYICRTDPRLNRMPYMDLIPAVRRALKDIYVPGQRLENEWGAATALQVAALLGSLGPLGGRVAVKKRAHRIEGRKEEVRKLLDEFAKQGLTELDRCLVPPGHVLLERMLKRYRELVAEIRAEGAAEASRSTLPGGFPAGPASSQDQPSGGPPRGRAPGGEGQQSRDVNNMKAHSPRSPGDR